MKIDVAELDGGLTKVALNGRMDIDGTNAVDLPFNTVAGSKSHIVVDMSEVSFLASLGMRTLVTCAKTVSRRGGGLVLLNPQPNVEKVLRSAGLDTVIPIVADIPAARAALRV